MFKVVSRHTWSTKLEGFASLEEAQQAALQWWCEGLRFPLSAADLKGFWVKHWDHGPTWNWVSEWGTLEAIGFILPSWEIKQYGSAA